MDDKTLGAVLIGIVYPIIIVFGLIGGILLYAYFLPERKRTSKKSFDQKN